MTDDDSRVLPEAIVRAVRTDILAQRLPAGAAVTEAVLAGRFGVARPTARLAIERLVTEGLLAREAHRSARVPRLTPDDVADLFDTRAVLEAAAVARLARDGAVPPEAVAAHRSVLDAAAADAPAGDADLAFHRALVAGQRGPRLTRLHGLLLGEIELGIAQVQAERLLAPREIAREHQAILDAIVASDPRAAEAAARSHVLHARELLLVHLETPAETEGTPW
ncbi:MAG: GntR family transcriptional regulator [Actinomycetales bacterium]|nr:GntR family transcriptional regulator [Actinomycetales bacterium]